MIDFEPAQISELRAEADHVAIVFPSQLMFGEHDEERPSSHPLVHCELKVWGGISHRDQLALPLKAENIRVRYRLGERRCFLPVDFHAEGPVHVFAEIASGLLLLAEGESVSLRIVERVGTVRVSYGARPDA